MSRVVVSGSLADVLTRLTGETELCDETGRVLGRFVPAPAPSPPPQEPLGGKVLRYDRPTDPIAVGSTQLPQPFHRDPADQIIVATARTLGVPLLTADARILNYPHVTVLT